MIADVDALNYPYIRVRSADWLKRTLLIFPHVVRMTPFTDGPADDPEVSEFCSVYGRRGPLLRPADLMAPYVHKAQRDLIDELKGLLDDKEQVFREQFRYGAFSGKDGGQTWNRMTVWERRLSNRPTFQIHKYKMLDDLTEFLMDQGLAWKPKEEFSDGHHYLEMHPRLGEAVMATLAFACAENEGLQVVTEFPDMHGKLIQQPKGLILRACLEEPKSSGKTSGQQVAEFIVYRRCDVSKLTAERIVALKSERDALAVFRGEMEELAKTLPPTIHGEPHLEDRLNDLANDIFKRWQADQANLSSYARELFGEGALDEPAKLIQKLTEAAVTPSTLASSGAAAVAGAHLGGLTIGLAAAAAAGFVVAVIFRAINAWGAVKRTERDTPFRYLTTLADDGVIFSLSR